LREYVVETVEEESTLAPETPVTVFTTISYWSSTIEETVYETITYTIDVPTNVYLAYTEVTEFTTVTYYSPSIHAFLSYTETYVETVAYYDN